MVTGMVGTGRFTPAKEEMRASRVSHDAEPSMDQELLQRVMTSVVKMEKDVRRVEHVERKVAMLDGKIDAQAVDLQSVGNQTRDLMVIKKIAVAVVSMLAPYLVTTITNTIKSYQRLEQVEKNVQQYNDRSAQVVLDVQSIRQRMEQVGQAHQRDEELLKKIDQLNKELESLRKKKR
jgi:hypothetical protein